MDLFGPLLKIESNKIFLLVLIDYFLRWVKPIALRRAEVADVVSALKQVKMPPHGVPAILLLNNGPQFTASAVRCFCESVRVRKIYSIPYHP